MSFTGWLQQQFRKANPSGTGHRAKPGPSSWLGLELLESRVVPTLLGNPLFPADNPWNQKITDAPVAANSDTLVGSIGLTSHFHPDFGTTYAGALNGIPFNVVSGTQPKVPVTIDAYPDESDLLPIPIPSNAVIEGDPLPSNQNTGDRHMLVYDKDHNLLYETFNTHRPSEEPDGQWHADSEAVWDLSKDSFRTPGFTSADAAGLPILTGLVRPDEVLDQGKITHALRFTVPRSDNAYVFPASHYAGSNNPVLPRMGERFRLKQSVNISGFSPANQVILQALKDYGMIVADNGSGWYLSGEPSSRWDDNDLHNLSQIVGSDFEAVDLTPVVSGLDQNSGSTAGGATITITGLNFSGGAGQTQILFGTVAATNVTVLSDTQLTATIPAHAAGTVDVVVQSPYGTSAATAADRYTFGPSSAANQAFVAQAYLDLLQRPADTGGLATWTTLLNQGMSRTAVVEAMESSPEYRADVVQSLYTQYLHRIADTGGLTGFVAFLGAGGSAEQVAAIMAGSSEYFQTRGGGSNSGFITALYQDALNRTADAGGQAAFSQALANGMTRTQVAAAIVSSAECHRDLVQGYYQAFLRRAADSGGLNAFTTLLGQGTHDQDVIAFVMGSNEYLARL
ncbi:MAG TPA: DUF4214 domain-containing protein [Gemmataceae bacterium]|nr:DUF4214 domain-containing protein [Gemmataceae bacterium]